MDKRGFLLTVLVSMLTVLFCSGSLLADGLNSSNFVGDWIRNSNYSEHEYGSMIISNQNEQFFDFYLEAGYGMYLGVIEGKAEIIEKNKAQYKVTEETIVYFSLLEEQGRMLVTHEGYDSLGLGLNVTIDGEYVLFCPEQENEVKVVLDGNALHFDVPPQIMNHRTVVPLRAIFEAMGAIVDWEGSTQTVIATKGNIIVILEIGSISPTINGEVASIDQPAVVVDGRTLAPLRFVAEAFGGTVNWVGEEKTAYISTK